MVNSLKYGRVHNFYAGPAAIPLEVMEQIHSEWFNFGGSGMGLMELSHRSKEYDAVHMGTIEKVKKLLGVGDDYHVMLLQGGASLQFGVLPMSMLGEGKTADYINTGAWSDKAIKEAKKIADINVAFEGKDVDFKRLPKPGELKLTDGAEYLYYCSNNTIKGTQFFTEPGDGKTPLVCDMSSDIFSHRLDGNKYAMIFAGAQKNLGPSGVTLVVMRDDFYQKARTDLTTMLCYKTHVEKDSLYNTPNTFGIYTMGLVLQWILDQGGLEGVEKINRAKADLLYGYMDQSGFYNGAVDKDSRSWMNVCMRLPNEELEAKFVADGKAAGFLGLKGHRSVGGIRVSMYNASNLASIEALVGFMKDFKADTG